MQPSIADIRKDYKMKEPDRSLTVARGSPSRSSGYGGKRAMASDIDEVNAMTLATVSAQGLPEARIVLLKGFDPRGFVFYTNYDSHKGQALAAHPQACLVFFWRELERQVRGSRGAVEKTSARDSETYFRVPGPPPARSAPGHPHRARLSRSRDLLDKNVGAYTDRFSGSEIPLPPFWGGYRVAPATIEFWQGSPQPSPRPSPVYTGRGGKRLEHSPPRTIKKPPPRTLLPRPKADWNRGHRDLRSSRFLGLSLPR